MAIFTSVLTPDNQLNRIQANIASALNLLQPAVAPFINGNLVSVQLSSGKDNLISHGIGRQPNVWINCGMNASGIVWSQATSLITLNGVNVNSNSLQINLRTTVSCTGKMWFA